MHFDLQIAQIDIQKKKKKKTRNLSLAQRATGKTTAIKAEPKVYQILENSFSKNKK